MPFSGKADHYRLFLGVSVVPVFLYHFDPAAVSPIGASQAKSKKERQSMDTEVIRQLIETGLPGSTATVSGADGVHFEAIVISDAFTGKPTLQRHRLVYATLGARMGDEIHALSLSTLAPGED